MKIWLKRVYSTVHMGEVRAEGKGWVRKTLEELLECKNLLEVTIELSSKNEGDRDLMQRVLGGEIRPVASQVRRRVFDECIEIRHVRSWWPSGRIAD